MVLWNRHRLETEPTLQLFERYGGNLEDANVFFQSDGPGSVRPYVIRKRPRELFNIDLVDFSSDAPWMRAVFDF
jgi:hypothetical protein